MTMSDAIELVLYAFKNGKSGEIFIKKTFSATRENIISAIKSIYGKPNSKVKVIGVRHGEKMHETLMSAEEKLKSEDKRHFYIIPYDKRDLNYDTYFTKGSVNLLGDNYSSDNVKQLSISELKKIILNYQKNNKFDQ
jgi:UDP-glucose 4-epimerase